MFYLKSPAAGPGRRKSHPGNFVISSLLLLLAAFGDRQPANAQAYRQELDTPEKVSLKVKSRSGRVSVIALDEQIKKVSIEASSAGGAVDGTDVRAVAKGTNIDIDVRDRRDKNRIDLVVRIPSRSRVIVEGEAGSIDIVGNVESAEVSNKHRNHPC